MLIKDKKLGIYYLDIRKYAKANIVSRGHGRRIRHMIEVKLKLNNFIMSNDKIVIDFSNISIASPSFLDEAFAKLFLKYPLYIIQNNLSLENMTDFDRALLNELISARIREKESLEKTPKSKFQLAQKQRG